MRRHRGGRTGLMHCGCWHGSYFKGRADRLMDECDVYVALDRTRLALFAFREVQSKLFLLSFSNARYSALSESRVGRFFSLHSCKQMDVSQQVGQCVRECVFKVSHCRRRRVENSVCVEMCPGLRWRMEERGGEEGYLQTPPSCVRTQSQTPQRAGGNQPA